MWESTATFTELFLELTLTLEDLSVITVGLVLTLEDLSVITDLV